MFIETDGVKGGILYNVCIQYPQKTIHPAPVNPFPNIVDIIKTTALFRSLHPFFSFIISLFYITLQIVMLDEKQVDLLDLWLFISLLEKEEKIEVCLGSLNSGFYMSGENDSAPDMD